MVMRFKSFLLYFWKSFKVCLWDFKIWLVKLGVWYSFFLDCLESLLDGICGRGSYYFFIVKVNYFRDW